ncbi:dihydroxyacetone kinase subunit L (plasmid) [Burkholderia humptydooensis]|uniref:Dihydroxyacetone kinase subunit L n=2 Tax=Burkholderia humptydooensis TaxID=430531 RepID=A0A7U4P7V9_9BURK|nr:MULTISPECIES: dihydroxyacetone kinase subunit DhaL [Burkholderia]AJY38274.1 dihydroxyacetone kinase, L subunit [Burkholderia sp. 2002721687]ALX44604.1 dihydroxyacetone kinase [Burkholderia humptydooensis]QPS42013.1 dihydroxyacetone kinase subunit L [Burkholderia humptydooensis]
MTPALTTADMARLFRELADAIAKARDELCRLDGVIGDADHGIAMEQGFTAASKAIGALSAEATLADQLNAAAKAFLNAVGASSGPLYATAFMCAAKVAGARQALPLNEAPGLIIAMAEGIRSRGRAEVGEKTMVDAWVPAAAAIEHGVAAGLPVREIMTRAGDAATAGAGSTIAMVATRGRSSRLGERSIGHMDPGAASAAMVVNVNVERALRPSNQSPYSTRRRWI